MGAMLAGLVGARTVTTFSSIFTCRGYMSVLLAVKALLWVRGPYPCFAVVDLAAL